FSFVIFLLPPLPPLFPYTTLFRSAVTLVLVAHAVVEIALGVDDGRHEPRGASLRTFGYLRPLVADRLVIAFGTGTGRQRRTGAVDRKSTRLNSSHVEISYAVFCLK